MRINLIKTMLVMFFFLGIALTSAYAGNFAQKDSTNQKLMKMDKSMDMSKTMKMDSKKAVKVINLKAIDKNKDGKVYQCPMDFDVLSDKPGKDPKCGMELTEVTIEQAKKNLTDHGFKVK